MIKRLYLTLVLLACILFAFGQQHQYSAYYYQRVSLFEALPVTSSDIIFLGNSITDGGEWNELFADPRIKNRGISGDMAQGIYERLGPIVKGKPKKIFLMIGINDVSRGAPADTVVARIGKVIGKIRTESPKTNIYLQSILPVNDSFGKFGEHTSRGDIVKEINRQLEILADREKITYIDLYSRFKNENDDKMNPEYTNDGLHLLGKGYLLWKSLVEQYVKER